MARKRTVSRRTALKVTGAAAATALVAGCSDNGDDDNGNGGDDGNGNGGDPIEAGTTIELYGETAGWEGIAPSEIEDETNPTLVLEDGAEYELGWPEGNGESHNIEIRDDDGEVVDDLSTDETTDEEPGDDQMLEFEASEEMASYVCDPHDSTMDGEIIVE